MKEQRNDIMGLILPVQEVIKNYIKYIPESRPYGERVRWYMDFLPSFIDAIEAGKEFTDDELGKQAYKGTKNYVSKLKGPLYTIAMLRSFILLYNDIKEYGLKIPIDMYRENGKLAIADGWRRLVIADKLGYKKMGFRVFRNEKICQKRQSPKKKNSVFFGPISKSSIHGIAMDLFAKIGYEATNKYWTHGFTRYYDSQIGHLRKNYIKLLEMGVGNGASLLLWKDAFPKAQIYGLTRWIVDWKKNLKDQKRIKVFVGHQEDEKFLEEQIIPIGPFHVIIDDAGHKPEHQMIAFKKLWSNLSPGGYYVIEDLQENYWERNKEGPLTIQYLQKLLAMLQNKEESIDVFSIVAYHNICFIRKMF